MPAEPELFQALSCATIEFLLPDNPCAMPYLYDSSGCARGDAVCVILPKTESQMVRAVQACIERKIPVTVRGNATGTAGGCIPRQSAVIFTGLLRSVIIHTDDHIAEVEPGALCGEIKDKARNLGLDYPPAPASFRFSTIGGNIATNAGGPFSVRYGTTRDYIRKIRIIDGKGQVLEFGAPTQKNSTGYFLPSLFCGSEGTLGVLTRAWLKLVPREQYQVYFEIPAPRYEDFPLFRQHGFSAMEYLDESAGSLVTGTDTAYLLLSISASTSGELMIRQKQATDFLHHIGYAFRSGEKKGDIWGLRESLSPLSYTLGSVKIAQDIVLPLSRIPLFLKWFSEERKKKEWHGITAFAFGHLGDGNLHVNLMTTNQEAEKAEQLRHAILIKTKELDGLVSGEHGLGISRKQYLPFFAGQREYEIMEQIKKVFDPNGLINPGVLF